MPPHASVHWPWLSLASVRYVGCACRLMQVYIGRGCCLQVYDSLAVHAASCKCTLAVAVACKCTIRWLCMPPHASVHWPWLSLASVRYVGCACRLMQVCIGLCSRLQVYDTLAVHAASCKSALGLAVTCNSTIGWLYTLIHASVHWAWQLFSSVQYVGFACRLMQVYIGCRCSLQVYDMLSLHASSCKCTLAVAVACKYTIRWLCSVHAASCKCGLWMWLPVANVRCMVVAAIKCAIVVDFGCKCAYVASDCKCESAMTLFCKWL
jgi:hypothetical protein